MSFSVVLATFQGLNSSKNVGLLYWTKQMQHTSTISGISIEQLLSKLFQELI